MILISYIDGKKKVGDKVNLTVYRDGKIINLTAILTKRPATATTTDNSQSNYPIIPQPQNPDNNNNDLFPNFPNLP